MATIFEKIRAARSSYPVDVDGLAESLGISVRYAPMPAEISGALVCEGKSYAITVNSRHPRTRQRFTLAHELGHYIHHRHIIGGGVNDSKAYKTTGDAEHFNPRILPKHETEANQFAVSLLMPKELVDQLSATGMSAEAVARELEVAPKAAAILMNAPLLTRKEQTGATLTIAGDDIF